MENDSMESTKKSSGKLKKIFTIPLLYLEAFLIMALGEIIGMSVRLLPGLFPSLEGSDAWITASDYSEFWGMWLIVILTASLIKKNKPILHAIGKNEKGNTVRYFSLGLLLGFLMNALCVLMAVLCGNIHLVFNSFNIVSFILVFIAVFIQSGAEEIVCRVFLYQRLRKAYKSPLFAVIGNSVFFAFLHIFNDGSGILGILNTFVIALLFSVIVYYTGSFWCVAAIHTAWNFTQNILFGLPNSGNVLPYSVFTLIEGASDGFFYNRAFGIEGALFSSLVIIAVTILVVFHMKKHNAEEVNIWTDEGCVTE